MDELTALEHYFMTLGMDARAIKKVLSKFTTRDLQLIQQKVADYQTMFRVDERTVVKMITFFPSMLSCDVTSDSPTSIQSKIRDFQKLLHTDEQAVLKMCVTYPVMLGLDTAGDGPTSVKSKIKNYQALLQTDEKTVTQMIVAGPQLLCLDTVSDSPTSVKTKIKKITEVMPLEKLRACGADFQAIFTVPAQAFKVRYMLAENMDVTQSFLRRGGFMTSQSKVWARYCYLNRHPGVFNLNNVYTNEKMFTKRFGVASVDLMQKYPLDRAAVTQIEQVYYIKTGHQITLDQQERAVLGLEA